jgi:hypothetical protein
VVVHLPEPEELKPLGFEISQPRATHDGDVLHGLQYQKLSEDGIKLKNHITYGASDTRIP